MTLAGLKIVRIDGGKVEFDEIQGFTCDTQYATIAYTLNGKQRKISIESEAVEFVATDV